MKKPLVVITGASSGIGAAMARSFNAEGFPLLLLARRVDQLEALQLSDTLCRQVDVSDSQSMSVAITEAEGVYGPVDCLINNAGCMLLGQMDSQNPAEWKQMFDVNVLGLLNGVHLVLAGMKERQCGTIINVSSVAGRKTFPNHAAYCGTKFAVHAISENLREEVADKNVRVITLAPGAVETELLSHTTSQEVIDGYQEWKEAIGGAIRPQDISASALFAYQQPQNVCIREIVIAPTKQEP
ncbi:SDR family oxidoreductase [Neptuniibacter sp. 2_MG-2023]|uniref:SDR family oxidoreductase n=1 Tax=Neptuniibacter sp. 2_MG-2023 TaxID=3062671 RepID=UPI0026E220CF|nr:SDR family oxidoreductase [Neptuniibacter sp. 2_MG-2023]MDO6514949.1 SDR family oxidoreductase [Neptuniibacter sp. 2_MG-2023]